MSLFGNDGYYKLSFIGKLVLGWQVFQFGRSVGQDVVRGGIKDAEPIKTRHISERELREMEYAREKTLWEIEQQKFRRDMQLLKEEVDRLNNEEFEFPLMDEDDA